MKALGFGLALLLVAPIASAADDRAARGEAVFKSSKCATCHGADGSANTPVGKTLKVRDLRSKHVQEMKDADIMATIRKGKNKMPAFKTLSNDDLRVLVAFIRKLGS